jgi:Protein of unknown function (DUF4242)
MLLHPVRAAMQPYRQLALARAELPGESDREDEMPVFMDYHDDLKLPPEAVEQIAQGARDGATDEFGVRQIELYHNSDGKVYCLLDGPDEEAIRMHHAALNVPCGDVHQVNSLR